MSLCQNVKEKEEGLFIGEVCLPYADDMMFCASSARDIQVMLADLTSALQQLGLHLNQEDCRRTHESSDLSGSTNPTRRRQNPKGHECSWTDDLRRELR